MHEAESASHVGSIVRLDRDAWVAMAREAALAHRNRDVPECWRTHLPRPRRCLRLRVIN